MDVKIRNIWPGITIAAFVSLGTMLASLSIPIFLITVYGWVIPARSASTLAWVLLAGFIAVTTFALLEYLRGRILQRLSNWLGGYLGLAALEASVTNVLFGGKTSGQVLRDVGEVRNFVANGAVTDALDLIWVPLLVVILFLIDPAFSVVAVVGVVLTLALAIVNDRVTHRALMQANERAAAAVSQTSTMLKNAEVIHALGLGSRVALRWARSNRAADELSERPSTWNRALVSASIFVRMSVTLAIVAVGALLLMDGSSSAGRVFAGALIIRRTLAPCGNIIERWRQWLQTLAAYKRVQSTIGDVQSRRLTKPLSRPQGSLDVDRLVFVPPGGDRAVLRGVSFSVDPGEVLGVIGPSAAGKSTLARMLVGLWRPTSGGVYLDGQSVFLWERTSFGKHVGYLPQAPGLFDGTVRENIARLDEAEDADVIHAAKQAGAHDMISRLPFGYSTEVSDGTLLLSGGQRQRLGLARALFGNPHLLVLDEPDANLDEAGREALRRAILEAKAAGAIVVLVSHQLSTIRQVADKVLALRNGAVERYGTKQAVLPAIGSQRKAVGALRVLPGEASRPADGA